MRRGAVRCNGRWDGQSEFRGRLREWPSGSPESGDERHSNGRLNLLLSANDTAAARTGDPDGFWAQHAEADILTSDGSSLSCVLPWAGAPIAVLIFALVMTSSPKIAAGAFYLVESWRQPWSPAVSAGRKALCSPPAGAHAWRCWPPIWAENPFNAAIRIIAIGLGTSIVFKAQSAEEATRLTEAEWREVFEHNSVMYFMVDASAAVRLVNAFGSAQLGYRADELIGQSVFQLYSEADRERVRANLDLCLESLGQSNTWEVQKVRKDGETLWVRETATAIDRAKRRRGRAHCGRRHHRAQARGEVSSGKREALSGPDRARLRCGVAVGRQYRSRLRQPFDRAYLGLFARGIGRPRWLRPYPSRSASRRQGAICGS